MYKLCFYVPESHLDKIKEAVFNAGAGKIGDYDRCCWQVLGEGQFRPKAGSTPFIGEQGVIEKVSEYKVEMVCSDDCIASVVDALKFSHPYEEPAYNIAKLDSDF